MKPIRSACVVKSAKAGLREQEARRTEIPRAERRPVVQAKRSGEQPKQLDSALYQPLSAPAGASALKRFGRGAWGATDIHVVLDQPARQAPDGDFARRLQNLPDGTANGDLPFWTGRWRMFIPHNERGDFEGDSTVQATCYNRDRKNNTEYLWPRLNTIIVRS
jgi:hypothetical protein